MVFNKKNKGYHPNQVPTALKVANMVLLIACSLLFLSPLWWMISTSLKTMQEIMAGEHSFFPNGWHFENYVHTWNTASFTQYTVNTLIITILVVIGKVLVNSFVAYGFSRLKFPGKNILFALVLSTMMIPGFVTLVLQYILFTNLGWINTYFPLFVPQYFGDAFSIFLLRQFFMTIPEEMLEAAKVEGASQFYIWRKIAIPMVKPA